MKSCEREFEDNLARVRKEAHRAAKRYHAEFEEMFAEASLHFVVAHRSFESGKNKQFSSWATFKMAKGMASTIRQESRRAKLLPRVKLKDVPEKPKWDIRAFAKSLSRDAMLAVRIALLAEDRSDFHKRREVVRLLKRKNWTRERIAAAFAEVRSALRG